MRILLLSANTGGGHNAAALAVKRKALEMGAELDGKIAALMAANSRISVTQAAIVTALEYADAAKKSEITSENLRNQIQEYLEDAARARTDVEISKREIDRLTKEIAALKAR